MSSRPNSLRRAPQAAIALALLLAATWARADAEDTLSLIPAISLMHDDNLFRLTTGARSEDATVSSLTLRIDKRYSLQRFEFETSYIDYRYKNFGYLSYNATPYKAAWRWSLTPYLHGNLTTDSTTSIQSFADSFNITQRNLNTTKNTRFDAVFDVSGSWHLLGGVSEYDYRNSQITLGQGDNRVNRGELGVRHTFSSGSQLSYIASSGRGEYLNRPQPIGAPSYLDNHFDESRNEVRLLWLLTGKTRLDANVAYIERNHDNFASRDYAGTVGSANLNWNISGGAFLTTIVARELESYQTINANYISTDRIALMPYWQLGAKTVLRTRYDYAKRDYLGTPGAFDPSGRKDTVRTAMVGVDWQPTYTTTISASVQNQNRNSNQADLDYKDNTINISAQIMF